NKHCGGVVRRASENRRSLITLTTSQRFHFRTLSFSLHSLTEANGRVSWEACGEARTGRERRLLMRRSSRRDFLKHATLIATGYWVSGIPAQSVNRSPNEKLNIGIIGVNNRGAANLKGVSGENIVALCDIDDNYL